MNPEKALKIIAILLIPLLDWLEEQAGKTDTPIDNVVVSFLRVILAGRDKS